MPAAQKITATILGCGSSGGVPRIGNVWGDCDPSEPRNRRLRCSLLLEGFSEGSDTPTRVVIDTGDEERPHLVGHNLRAYIGDLEERMRKAAADLEFEEAGRLRDEIRRLEEDELGIPDADRVAPRPVGNSNQGKPGTRRTGYGKTQRRWGGKR